MSSFFKVSGFSDFRRNPFDPEVLHINDSSSLHNSHFNFNNKVKILAHGWLNHGYSPMPESIKEGKYLFSSNTYVWQTTSLPDACDLNSTLCQLQ